MKILAALSCFALVVSGIGADHADAKRYRSSHSTKRVKRSRGLNFYPTRGTTEGACPCNGGNVCVGPRGGRYCITSGGNKRYGV